MLNPPRRSVTRFFIPLIDVLILLFAIFLLMPFVSGPAASESNEKAQPKETLPADVAELQKQLKEERDRVERLRQASQASIRDRLSVRVLQIDRRDGALFYYNPDRQEIRTETDALSLIGDQRATSVKQGKDMFFLILLPAKSSFPTQEQVDQIRQWFKTVPIGFDRYGG